MLCSSAGRTAWNWPSQQHVLFWPTITEAVAVEHVSASSVLFFFLCTAHHFMDVHSSFLCIVIIWRAWNSNIHQKSINGRHSSFSIVLFYFSFLIISPCLSSHSFILVVCPISSPICCNQQIDVSIWEKIRLGIYAQVSQIPLFCPFYLLVTHNSHGDGHKHTCTLTCANSHAWQCTVWFWS